MAPIGSWVMPPNGLAITGRARTLTTVGLTPMTAGDTTLASQLATITTDTGAFALGHQEFTRYSTPAMCRAAAQVARTNFQRGLEFNTNEGELQFDSVGLGATAAVARACGARFTLANTTDAQQGDLFELALYEQNDALAQAVFARQLAKGVDIQTVSPVNADGFLGRIEPEETDIWESTFMQYLRFRRDAAMQALLAQVEAQGAVAYPRQLWIRRQLQGYYRDQRLVLQTHQDTLARLHNDSLLIRLGMAPSARPFGYLSVFFGYRDLMNDAVFGDSTDLHALVLQAKRDLGVFPHADIDWTSAEVSEAQYKALVPEWYRFYQAHASDQPAPRVQADFWFPPPGRPPADTIIPIPGKFNLICGGGRASDWLRNSGEATTETGIAYTAAVNIKRWLAQYGKDGLTVTIVRAAIGAPWLYNADRGTKDVFVQDSTAEAGFWHWYDQTYHQLPVTEAVVVLHTTEWLPPPDGRRVRVVQTLDNDYFNLLNELDNAWNNPERGACTLIGPEGRILYQRNMKTHEQWGLGDNNMGDWSDVLHWIFTWHTDPASAAKRPPLTPTR